MSSWPASAGPRVPETGASTNRTSGRMPAAVAASCCVACTPMVPIWAQIASGASAWSMPWPTATEVAAAASDSIVITTSACATAWLG